MPTDDGRRAARDRVGDELARRELSPAELARRADVDSDTVNDFLAGKRWPQAATRGKVSRALDWEPEGIDQIARGEAPTQVDGGIVGTSADDAGVLASLPPEALEGLSAADREEVITAAKLSALRAAREIRRRLDE